MNVFFKRTVFAAQLIFIALISFSPVIAAGEIDFGFKIAVKEDGSLINVQVIEPQTDGKLLVGGVFTVVGNSGRTGIVGFNADNTVDDTFVPPNFYKIFNNALTLKFAVVQAIAIQANGKIIIGGEFSRVNQTTKNVGVARLLTTAVRTRFDFDGDGNADVAVFRPSNGAWYLLRSTQGFTGVAFGDANDKPIPNAFIR